MSSPHLVFTYGTLKKGEPNHYVMTKAENGKSTYLGQAVTVKKYPLIITTMANLPFVLLQEGTGQEVDGEVYEVDNIALSILDDLERHPEFYRREEAETLLLSDQDGQEISPPKPLKCWIYFMPDFKKDLLKLQFFKSYSSVSESYPPYVSREDRTGKIQISELKE